MWFGNFNMQLVVVIFVCVIFSQTACLTDEEAKALLCSTEVDKLDGAVVVTNQVLFSTICGIGEGDCRDVFPMTDFGIPLECSQVVQNNQCGQANIIEGDFCALSCERCVKCQSTFNGCRCQKDWVYKETGQTFNGCQLPDNDQRGPWCYVDESTCETPPEGKTFDYCDRRCVEEAKEPPPPLTPVQETQEQNQGLSSETNSPVANNTSETVEVSTTDLSTSNVTTSVVGIADEWLSAHNEYRQQHCAPNLVWDEELAAEAQQIASTCNTDTPAVGNQLTTDFPVPADAIAFWYQDVVKYDFSDASPAPTTLAQVLWKSSERVGCGISDKCEDGQYLIVCMYDPPGNFQGQYLENVLPQTCGNEESSLERAVAPKSSIIVVPETSISIPETTNLDFEPEASPISASAWTDAHNTYRQQHCVGDLKWSQSLANIAKKAALSCGSEVINDNYGKNSFLTSQSTVTADEVVTFWYTDGSGYNFENPVYDPDAGTLTQVIWKGSTEVGCGVGQICADGQLYVYCVYTPTGNIVNQMSQNIQNLCK